MPKTRVKVTTYGKDGSRKTEIVELEVPEIEDIEDFWCECAEVGEVSYHPDEFDEQGHRLIKHHYRCKGCGKVVQIG